jgi:hypothetical protein
VPSRWPEVGLYLKQQTRHDFPVLGRLLNQRNVRAITAVLSLNLDHALSVLPSDVKLLADVVFAGLVGNATFATGVAARALSHGVSTSKRGSSRSFVLGAGITVRKMIATVSCLLHLALAAALVRLPASLRMLLSTLDKGQPLPSSHRRTHLRAVRDPSVPPTGSLMSGRTRHLKLMAVTIIGRNGVTAVHPRG